jgi:hypothetical protein
MIVIVPPGVSGDGATERMTGVAEKTVRVAVPLCPSLVAVNTAVPIATPVAVRTFDTKIPLAIALFDDVQVKTLPESTFPLASFAIAVRTAVPPMANGAAVGVMVTVATGSGAVTVIADVPLFPSLVAVIVAEPIATPVTSPAPFTVALLGSDVDQTMARPVSTLPSAASVEAVSCRDMPAAMVAAGGAIVTVASGCTTVICVDPVFPSLVAVTVAVPTATAVATPPAVIVTFEVSDELQMTARPVRILLLTSDVVAANCCVAPMTIVGDAGATTTLATGAAVTAIVCVPVFPPACALMTDCPTAMPVINPVDDTVAIAGEPEDQVTAPIEIAALFWSSPAAVAVEVWPTGKVDGDRVTVMVVSTGGCGVGTVGLESLLPPHEVPRKSPTMAMPQAEHTRLCL